MLAVAPGISEQMSSAGQRSHWNAYALGDPVHVPVVAVSGEPTTGLPLIEGRTWLRASAPSTTSLGVEMELVEPVRGPNVYDEWLAGYRLSPVLKLPTDKLDYLTDLVDRVDLFRRIEKHL